MNKERIEQLAQHLDNIDEPQFSMKAWFWTGTNRNKRIHECGSPSCMCGHAVAMFNPAHYAWLIEHEHVLHNPTWIDAGSHVLDIPDTTATFLFMPSSHSCPSLTYSQYLSIPWEPVEITAKEAAKVLRHLAATGTVDYFAAIYGTIEDWHKARQS